MSTGIKMRGSPDGYNLTHGFKWGIGGAFPSRSRFRVHRRNVRRGAVRSGAAIHRAAIPRRACRREWDPDATRHLFGGFQYNATNGIYFGAGVTYTASYYLHRRDFTMSEDSDFDRLGLQVRIGYHPSGVRTSRPGRHRAAERADHASGAGQPPAHGEGALRAVHGGSGPPADRVGRRTGSGWRHAALSLDRADRHVREPRRVARRRGPRRCRWARCR